MMSRMCFLQLFPGLGKTFSDQLVSTIRESRELQLPMA